ncbi:MAG: hypothetical protein AUJ85_08485 [Elusimicrobia bacterium CG1_02_37_114]|nr:MAG: hypothetical protein AUJ85_08485 [Elusimicrobia bacterium CG1_02_37_114]PIV53967.1 MAG: antitoxin [Elusimicrobia bacterium CG02_land_8_20_14_3_00_37_13]
MPKQNYINRIVVNPEICHGQPCFKGTRIMVYLVLELLEAGETPEQIIAEYYPKLTKDDIKAAIHYATELIKNNEFVPV